MLKAVSPTMGNCWQSVFACHRTQMETFLETVRELEGVQGVDKVVAVQGSPLPKANNKDAQETSCLQDAVGNHRHICDAAFRDAQSPWQHKGSRGFFVGHDGERKQVYQTRVDDVAKVEDVLHEEGPSDNTLWAWWPDRHKAVVVGVVAKQWREADVHAGSGLHEKDNLHGGETVGATPSSSVNN